MMDLQLESHQFQKVAGTMQSTSSPTCDPMCRLDGSMEVELFGKAKLYTE